MNTTPVGRAVLAASLMAGAFNAHAAPSGRGSGSPEPAPIVQQLSPKESFMLMFGKGNGAMRLLCALQKDGLIDQDTRLRWTDKLNALLSERGDSETDRRNARLGMAFADARPSLCPGRVMGRTAP